MTDAEAASNERIVVTFRDILLGRGTAANEHQGNQRFRALIKEQRELYNNAPLSEVKSRIVRQLLDRLYQEGTRFLLRVNTGAPVTDIITEGFWTLVSDDVALEKIKQAFRQKEKPTDAEEKEETETNVLYRRQAEDGENQVSPRNEGPPLAPAAAARAPSGVAGMPSYASASLQAPPNILPPLIERDPFVDHRPLLFQSRLIAAFQQSSPVRGGSVSAERMAQIAYHDFMQVQIQDMMRNQGIKSSSRNSDGIMLEYIQNRADDDSFEDTLEQVKASLNINKCEYVTEKPSATAEGSFMSPESDVDVAVAALAALALSDFPTISEEEEEIERASLSNEEKAAALSDLYGQICSLGAHQNKKQKRDLCRESIDFLVRQMKIEVDLIPPEKKQALLEARTKCRPEEFSDDRLEKFLRSEGVNTKLAAQRFINYWESRRELFGPEKYHLRMTLGEALCDDVDTLVEKWAFAILPYPDQSGRPLIYVEARRNTGDGYTAESLVRSCWYLMEIMAREHDDFVWILNQEGASLWNYMYDRFVITHVPYYYRSCWPVKMMPTHVCGSNTFIGRFVKPVLNATLNRAARSRTIIHESTIESYILNALSEYGIIRDALPTRMGGGIDLDTWIPLFIAQRRSIEMEEI